MKQRRESNSWLSPLGATGFSMAELLIVLAVFSVVLGVVFSSLGEGQKISAFSKSETEIQQNLEDVLTLVTTELRTAGYPPENSYDTQYLQNPSTSKNLVAQGLVEIAPQSIRFQGDINGNGRVDFVRYYLSGSSAPYSLNRFAGEINSDGSLPGGSPQKLSEQIESLQFKYFDSSGLEIASLQEVVTIQINLTLRSRAMDLVSRVYHTVSQSVSIRPPNL